MTHRSCRRDGVTPYNMCILKGFNTILAKTTTNVFPFGVWFANANTLYVADEGNGDNTNTTATSTDNGTVLRMLRPRRTQDYRNGYSESGVVEKRLYFAGGAQLGRALYRAWLSDWT